MATASWCDWKTRQRYGERRSGRVVQVLARGQHEVVGRVEMLGKHSWLLPRDARICPDIFIAPQDRLLAQRGVMAVAEITRYALTQEHPQGRIVEVLGSADAPDMELRLILRMACRRHFHPRSRPRRRLWRHRCRYKTSPADATCAA